MAVGSIRVNWAARLFSHHSCSILLELDIEESPVWHYLNSQYQYIIKLLKEFYTEQVERIDGMNGTMCTVNGYTDVG